jgi:integrase
VARSVYKICNCRDQVKCRHPWWFSVKHRGGPQMRKSLDVVLEKHIDSKTVAEVEAERLRIGMVDDTLTARTRELLGLPASTKPALPTLTIGQLLKVFAERHVARSATVERQGYQIGIVIRTVLPRPTGGSAALGEWLTSDVTADTLERLREARVVRDVHTRATGSNRVGGVVAANRDLRLLRAAFNWAIRTGYTERTPFKRGTVSAVTLTREAARSRRLQSGEEERLLPACNAHLRAIVEAALETGCRKGELLGLQWSQVQFVPRPELWLPADKTKTGKARRVPISTRLRPILEMRRAALRAALELKDDEPLPLTLNVFGNEIGQRIGAIKTAWRLACERAKVQGLHFHDLRREAGSRWMEAGVPLATIQKWLGHTNIAQTSTYLSTTTAGEHEAMRRFEERRGRLIPVDTEGGTPLHQQAQSTMTKDSDPQQNPTKH